MLNPIRHLVVLMMENRSFDHYLGALTLEGRDDIDGLTARLPTNQDRDGNPIMAEPLDELSPKHPDPPHDWDALHAAHNAGANDQFVSVFQHKHPDADPRIPMGFYTRQTLPVYYSLADQFTVCDRWFASVLSSTWPNRKYFHSGRRDEERDTRVLPVPPGFQTRPYYDLLEDCPDPFLPGPRLTWKCYFSDLPFLGFWYQFAAFHHSNFAPIARFVADCREDRLPTVSIIDPPFTRADDHPSHDPRLGQKFVGLIVDALTHSESWDSTALVITYDEGGGFYDHVAPPPAFDDPAGEDSPLGFRVPTLIVSPYAKRSFACHTPFDHTSMMRSVHELWEVPFGKEFGTRWQAAAGIWNDCFDFTQTPLPRGTYTGAPLRELNWGSGVHALLSAEIDTTHQMQERIFVLPELKPLDHRPQLYDNLAELEQQVISLKRMVSRP